MNWSELRDLAFTSSAARNAWKRSGMVPIDLNQIMSGWAGWADPTESAEEVIRRLYTLAPACLSKGTLEDEDLERHMDGIPGVEFDPSTRLKFECATHFS